MVDSSPPEMRKELKQQELNSIMTKIERQTNPPDGQGVVFIKDDGVVGDRERQVQTVANEIYDGLMLTLFDIAADAFEASLDPQNPNAAEYEAVFRAIEPLVNVGRVLADDRLPLQVDTYRQEKHASRGDRVYAYTTAGLLVVDQGEYDYVHVLIRPNPWTRPIGSKTTTRAQQAPRNVSEHAQARMTVTIKPKGWENGNLVIRVDREDAEHSLEVTYDIVVGTEETNPIKVLQFGDALQREGHHFSSKIKPEKMGVPFSEALEAMNKKLNKAVQGKK